MKVFYITTEYIELVRLLKSVGQDRSGGETKQLITDGLVTVDGHVETRKKCKILPGQEVLTGDIRILVKKGR